MADHAGSPSAKLTLDLLKPEWIEVGDEAEDGETPTPPHAPIPDNATRVDGASVRIATYNVLAQALVTRDQFPYCSKKCLKWKNRSKRLAAHVRNICAEVDVICMQEVDAQYAETWWRPFFDGLPDRQGGGDGGGSQDRSTLGWEFHFVPKTDKGRHGVGLAFSRAAYTVEHFERISFDAIAGHPVSDELATAPDGVPERPVAPSVGDAADDAVIDGVTVTELDAEELVHGTVGFAAALRSTSHPEAGIVVSNAHMFWNWRFRYVRTRQAIMLLKAATRVQRGFPSWPLVSCGDFNDCPDTIVYKLMTAPRPYPFVVPGRLFQMPWNYYSPEVDSYDHQPEDTITIFSSGLEVIPRNDDGTISPEAEQAVMEVRAAPAGPEANLPDDFRHVPHDHHVKRVDDMTRVIAAIDALPQLISVYGAYASMVDMGDYADESYKHFWEGEPVYTTVGEKWEGTLDYIYTADLGARFRLRPVALARIPSRALAQAQAGLPNDVYPSDHVPLMACFELWDCGVRGEGV